MTNIDPSLEDKALRKAWLKQKFASWEYHEELLRLHQCWLSAVKRHWSNVELQKKYPEDYRGMALPVIFNFDKVPKPGEIFATDWGTKTVGWADAISYNFSRGLGDYDHNEYADLPEEKKAELGLLVNEILDHSSNIRVTVEQRWDDPSDEILNEKYTGPISWPTNWKVNLLGEGGAALLSTTGIRAKAGEPVPRSGVWQAIDVKGTRQTVEAGGKLPDLHSAYGVTVWHFVQE